MVLIKVWYFTIMMSTAAKSGPPGPIIAQADALRRFVDRVAHHGGAVLSKMEDTGVTLPQILLLARVESARAASISGLAEASPGSAPAMSQMVDRLVRQKWLGRSEDPTDRRRKTVSLTTRGVKLLREIEQARTSDYAAGLSQLPATLRAELHRWLERALAEMDRGEPS